jgi:hypothetical protein
MSLNDLIADREKTYLNIRVNNLKCDNSCEFNTATVNTIQSETGNPLDLIGTDGDVNIVGNLQVNNTNILGNLQVSNLIKTNSTQIGINTEIQDDGSVFSINTIGSSSQLRLINDDDTGTPSNFADMRVDSSGNLNISASSGVLNTGSIISSEQRITSLAGTVAGCGISTIGQLVRVVSQTFSPVMRTSGNANNFTMNTATSYGIYIKTANCVTVNARYVWTANANNATQVQFNMPIPAISDLPYRSSVCVVIGAGTAFAAGLIPFGLLFGTSPLVNFVARNSSTGVFSNINGNQVAASGDIILSYSYFVDP